MLTGCPVLLRDGYCNDPLCRYMHSVQTCDPCSFMCITAKEMDEHLKSRIHVNRIKGQSIIFRCPLCSGFFHGRSGWELHTRGRKHRENVQRCNAEPQNVMPEEMEAVPNHTFCVTCSVHIYDQHWDRHVRKASHQEKEAFATFKVTLEETEKDKNGVTLDGNFDFGIIGFEDAAKGRRTLKGTLSTTIPTGRIILAEIKFASSRTSGGSTFKITGIQPGIPIKSGVFLTFDISFRQNYAGRCQDRLELVFQDGHLRTSFLISRPLLAIVGDKEGHEKLRATAPYVPRRKSRRQPETKVVAGIPPPTLKAVPYVVTLPEAYMPPILAETLSRGSNSQILSRIKSIFLPSIFDMRTYSRQLTHLLWIEEFQTEKDLEIYDMSAVSLSVHHPYYYLVVPGLAENRPSVLVGDRLFVQKQGSPEGEWYEGGVHVVRRDEVGLRFHRSFAGWSASQKYNVRFKLNRYPLRRQHQALDTAFREERILFPTNHDIIQTSYSTRTRLPIVNPLISLNPPQCQAVLAIAKRPPGSVPFIIFGPPGTGKTVTVVEAIRQVLLTQAQAKVLACAPSNSAADLIASQLRDLGTDTLFRFYAPSRVKDQVPLELMSYAHVRPDGHFTVPPMSRMTRFRVIVTTCVSASVVSGIGMRRGHFSHIFVDEAGQATEPEVAISIMTMSDKRTNVVLSGDPKQLGPIIRSTMAAKLGLEVSLIERLLQREPYMNRRDTTMIKLIKNFRSHPAILAYPNERFYDGDLEPCGDPRIINSYLNSRYLPKKNFPIVFHGLCGKDDREASSPSFFNIDEALEVKRYVVQLRSDRRYRATDNDIGVITPYNAQCRKIRTALRGTADGVKVGSVEEFQGQERRVVIISTVRSSVEFVEYDIRHTLGFVASPRRFNVAVTRAQALLIVIGDPSVLGLDPLWRSFLNYIHQNGGWTGSPIPWDSDEVVSEEIRYDQQIREAARLEMNDFCRRTEALTLANFEMNGDSERANVDRPWREVE